jgi:hypothetical protein
MDGDHPCDQPKPGGTFGHAAAPDPSSDNRSTLLTEQAVAGEHGFKKWFPLAIPPANIPAT